MGYRFLGLDFDGTVVTHEYPQIGKDIGAVPWLHHLSNSGIKIVLNTMRDKSFLKEAINWLESREVSLFGYNNNPIQNKWTTSPKVYAHVYVDDAALGTPLIHIHGHRPYVNWKKAGPMLCERFGIELP